ncbi:MAG TPA: hypothetical protein VNR59_01345 [Gaiellaceae bacterium]|nr:hypothetical protein [Gaiellaceae bacterium]
MASGPRSSPRRSTGRAAAACTSWRRACSRTNEAAIGLYRKFGFVEEGRRVQHMRRANGELCDLIDMGLLL